MSFRLQLDKRYDKLRQFLTVRFICGNKRFLEELRDVLHISAQVKGGSITRAKGSYQLQYAMKDGIIFFGYFYEDISENCLLGRKYEAFRKAVNEIRGGVV